MSSDESKGKFVFTDEEDRPLVKRSSASEYRVGDRVYLVGSDGSLDGPFLVASVSGQKCTLSFENGQGAKDGEEIDIARLQAA